MIRFFGLIPRRPDLSPDEFHDHYRYPHGAFGLGLPMERYIQSHQFDTPHLSDSQRTYEAIAEGWYESAELGLALAENPHYKKYLLPDEQNFVDLPRLKWLYADEVRIEVLPAADEIAQAADRYWDWEKAPITVKLLQFLDKPADDVTEAIDDARSLGAKRFAYSTPAEGVYAYSKPDYAAVRELWWPTETDLRRGYDVAPPAWQRLVGAPGVSLVARAERFR